MRDEQLTVSSTRPETTPVLAYVEHCLPGSTTETRVRLARDHGLALEVANRNGLDPEAARSWGVPVVSLEAYRMHEIHPLHANPEHYHAALRHVRDTVEKAARVGARRVVTVCGYGHEPVDRPFERCLDFFSSLVPFARDHGVRLLIEKLSRQRAGEMTDAAEIGLLIDQLAAPDVFGAVLDTGHLLDDGFDLVSFFRSSRCPVDEIHVKGSGSYPPPPDIELAGLLAALGSPPAVVTVEHRHPTRPAALRELVQNLRTTLEHPETALTHP
jgi:sugar phosphate isomerase/epimerase